MYKSTFAKTLLAGVFASLFLLAACSSTTAKPAPTATATTIPTATATPVLDTTFTSADGLYTFKYSGNWSQTPLNTSPFVDGVFLLSPDSLDAFLTLCIG